MIEDYPELANNDLKDNTKNEYILVISFIIRIIEQIILVFSLSYMFTMSWIILCEFVEDFFLDLVYKDLMNTIREVDSGNPNTSASGEVLKGI